LDGFSGINWKENIPNAERIITERGFTVSERSNDALLAN
jgi:hypothetical protein